MRLYWEKEKESGEDKCLTRLIQREGWKTITKVMLKFTLHLQQISKRFGAKGLMD